MRRDHTPPSRCPLPPIRYRMQMGEPPSVGNVARYIADVQHGYTRTGGARPLGVTVLVAGVERRPGRAGSVARLYQTEPAGTLTEW